MHNQNGWSTSHHPSLPTSRSARGQQRSVIAVLRSLVPIRLLSTDEAERLAERQADRLLHLAGISEPQVPTELIAELPRITVRLDPQLPVSGSAQWVSGRWLISLNAGEPWTRRRFSLMHEFKHVLDHPRVDDLYAGEAQAEHLADYFAASVLMPRRFVERLWEDGMRDLAALAFHFGVSQPAMAIRLQYLGLRQAPERHDPYHRPTTGRSDSSASSPYHRLSHPLQGALAS